MAFFDRSRIVWARDMGPAKNQELVDYYSGRKVWLLEGEQKPPLLTPYVTGGANSAGVLKNPQ